MTKKYNRKHFGFQLYADEQKEFLDAKERCEALSKIEMSIKDFVFFLIRTHKENQKKAKK